MVDESSLASTEQMRDFLGKIRRDDKVLLIGDVRQHQGVDAGKPFEQLQQSGMRSAVLDRIVRQRDPELLKAVEHLSKNETEAGCSDASATGPSDRNRRRGATHCDNREGVCRTAGEHDHRLARQRLTTGDQSGRTAGIAGAGMLERKIALSGAHSPFGHDGADRAWAARYQPGDVLHYVRGSKEHGIEPGSYAQVVTDESRKKTSSRCAEQDGELVTYDPSRLRGISAYREIEREFAVGDRVQLTAPNRELQVANRDLGTLQNFDQTDASPSDGQRKRSPSTARDASFRSRLCRHFAQLAGTNVRARTRQYGHRGPSGTHQRTVRLCLGFTRVPRRSGLHKRRLHLSGETEPRCVEDIGARLGKTLIPVPMLAT